jgi:hypothetical protein
MTFVILMWLFGIGAFLAQGVYILRTGQTAPPVGSREHLRPPISFTNRLFFASVYLFSSAAMALILGMALRRKGFAPVRAWLVDNSGMLSYMVPLAFGGLLICARPASMVAWTLRNNPELADDRKVLITTRLIGLGILLLALFIIGKL